MRDGDDYVINGRKWLITNSDIATHFMIIAKTDPSAGARGVSSFLIERDTPGLTITPLPETMGCRGGEHGQLDLVDVRASKHQLLGAEGDGLSQMEEVLEISRVFVASTSLGNAERSLELARDFASKRITFGKRLAERQAIQRYVAEMATDVYALRHMIADATAKWDRGLRIPAEAAMCKLFGLEAVGRVTDRALLVHGGIGYTRKYPIERLYPRRPTQLARGRPPDSADFCHRQRTVQRVRLDALMDTPPAKAALVVGASRGIGRATALALARDGFAVGVAARSLDAAQSVAREIEVAGGCALPLSLDIREPAESEAGVSQTTGAFARLDALVINAGINPYWTRAENVTPEMWDDAMAVNLRGAFFAAQAGGKVMLAAGHGSIVMVSSVTATVPTGRGLPYVATKGGMDSMMRALALEWGSRGIRVNCVAPGFVETDMTRAIRDNPLAGSAIANLTSLKRFGRPERSPR